VKVDHAFVEFDDALQGRVHQDLGAEIGDFVLQRPDGIPSYHLACAVDDAAQDITHVVRGADLIASTPRQMFLQDLLGLPTPAYLHLPVATLPDGEKLSKQTLAPAVDPAKAPAVLAQVLAFLGQPAPRDLTGDVAELLAWSVSNWSRARLPRRDSRAVPG
jgi:glutamyl-Q tRNA(Asp) synthetase